MNTHVILATTTAFLWRNTTTSLYLLRNLQHSPFLLGLHSAPHEIPPCSRTFSVIKTRNPGHRGLGRSPSFPSSASTLRALASLHPSVGIMICPASMRRVRSTSAFVASRLASPPLVPIGLSVSSAWASTRLPYSFPSDQGSSPSHPFPWPRANEVGLTSDPAQGVCELWGRSTAHGKRAPASQPVGRREWPIPYLASLALGSPGTRARAEAWCRGVSRSR